MYLLHLIFLPLPLDSCLEWRHDGSSCSSHLGPLGEGYTLVRTEAQAGSLRTLSGRNTTPALDCPSPYFYVREIHFILIKLIILGLCYLQTTPILTDTLGIISDSFSTSPCI